MVNAKISSKELKVWPINIVSLDTMRKHDQIINNNEITFVRSEHYSYESSPSMLLL